jgi:hypothetical protein
MTKITKEDIAELFRQGEEILINHYLLLDESALFFKRTFNDMEIRFEVNDYPDRQVFGGKSVSLDPKHWELEIYSDMDKNPLGFRFVRKYTEEEIKKIIFKGQVSNVLNDNSD